MICVMVFLIINAIIYLFNLNQLYTLIVGGVGVR